MKKLCLLLIWSTAYATSNNELLTETGKYCYLVEQSIKDRAIDNTLVDSINDCLEGNTFSFVGHGWSNFWTNSNEQPTLEKDGKKYKLQYFKNIDEIDDAVSDINDVIESQIEEAKQEKIAEQRAEEERQRVELEKIKVQKEKEAQTKKCNDAYYNSASYKNYINIRNNFIKTRYNNCINNGYSTITCYSYRLQDEVGYDIDPDRKPPVNNCQ
ncbi:MAG: hypothetical protein ORN24_02150 [Burkholderiales bacterium]|nr:hypothetical protein [Burkholderiales bacterium]